MWWKGSKNKVGQDVPVGEVLSEAAGPGCDKSIDYSQSVLRFAKHPTVADGCYGFSVTLI